MRPRAIRYLVYGAVAVFAVICLLFVATYIRLTRGPIELGFVSDRIQQALATQLPDIKISLGTAQLAIDPKSGAPRITFSDVTVKDAHDNQIASAPQAAMGLSGWRLLIGSVRPTSLDLIGPAISARRNLDGSFTMGFAAPDKSSISGTDEADQPEAETAAASAQAEQTSGALLLNLLDRRDSGDPLSSLQDIRVTDAKLRFYDDGNAATWFAPHIDLTFQKKPYGFVLLGKVEVATGDQPWHAELSATYNHETTLFEISSTIDNVVPASVAKKIFALSQFAAVNTPLSGHVDMILDPNGKLSAASGELQAGHGMIVLPNYFAEPMEVNEGTLQIRYAPEQDTFNLTNSSLNVGGHKVDIDGSLAPLRDANGKLTALAIKLKTQAKDEKADAGTPNVVVDHIEFEGRAGVEKARLDIDDLVVLSGNSGLRMRGNITAGERSPGIHVAGRLRDVNVDLLRTLWPPFVAPRSRTWIFANVSQGSIPEGTFQVNFSENQLADAKEAHHNPDGSIDFQFGLKDITTHYFKSLPDLVGGSGQGHVQDNSFNLDINTGAATMPSGDVIQLVSGNFNVDDLQAEQIIGKFNFELNAPLSAMVDVATNTDIKMVKPDALVNFPKATGSGRIKLSLQLPFVKDPPAEQVVLQTQANLTNVAAPNFMPGVDLTDGNLTIAVSQQKIDIFGPAKVNGQPAKLAWSKPRDGGPATAQLSAVLDEKSRDKLGIKLQDYLTGPVPVDANFTKDQAGNSIFDVKADLSKATMKVTALGWTRPPTAGTTATFRVLASDQGRSLQNFKLDGDGLHLRGGAEMAKDGKLKSVNMNEIRLDEDNVFSVRAIPGDGTTDLTITGTNFDARPYIKSVLAPPKTQDDGDPQASPTQDFTLKAHFDKVSANRGEIINDVTANLRARGGRIAEANIQGTFLNGQPVTATVVPLPQGRQMRVMSKDAGSAMRAANFYSKIAGGQLTFSALIGNETGSPLRDGNLTITDFDVRNEAALADLDKRGKPTKAGPRSEAVYLQHAVSAVFF